MVRLAAAEGLRALGDEEAENALIEALPDEERLVRRASLRSLRQIECELPELYLVKALEDPEPFV